MNSKTQARKGSITMFTAAISVLIVAIVALVTDVGYMYYEHARLQTATNAAWKAGFDKLSEIRKLKKNNLTDADFTTIKNHMQEVMAANGFANLTPDELKVLLTQNQTNLSIEASDDVGLFFMKIFDKQTATVSANRAGGEDTSTIMPIAIPHGEVHDLSWKTYDYIPFGDEEGFATGTEYIIKLGELEGTDVLGDEEYMIYIPCGLNGEQSGDARLLAYGAAFWALQIDERDNESCTPAYWLLSNNGGGFLLRTSDMFLRKLNGDYRGVTFQKLEPQGICSLLRQIGVNVAPDDLNDYLSQINNGVVKNDRILPLTNRPQIAVYSSQADADPVEQILRTAKIPYGKYALPNTVQNPSGWKRADNYDASKNSKIFDLEIINDELDKYDWIHLHHEDFTGLTTNDGSSYNNAIFPTRCSSLRPGCIENVAYDRTTTSVNSQEEADKKLKDLACAACKEHMIIEHGEVKEEETTVYEKVQESYQQWDAKTRKWVTKYKWVDKAVKKIIRTYTSIFKGWDVSYDELQAVCRTGHYQRCGTCGYFDPSDLSGQANFSGCKYYQYLQSLGFEDDDYIAVTPLKMEYKSGLSMQQLCENWFTYATAYQKMKWLVAEKVKDHILRGGFMYTQCFALETIDLALHQSAFYKTRSAAQAYDNCLAYTNFKYNQQPQKRGYSTIDFIQNSSRDGSVKDAYKFSPLCQISGTPNTGQGATDSINGSTIKGHIDKMSEIGGGAWQYIGGKVWDTTTSEYKGQFAMMGGHNAGNTNAKRFVLNNVLFGSTSDKQTSVGTHLSGRTKYQYGCIDPDNDGHRSSVDYMNRMLYGFDSPINFADIISTDNSKYTKESEQGVQYITNHEALASYTPDTIVIVPIVGTPESVQQYQSGIQRTNDQQLKADDYTIYDIKVGDSNNGAADSDNLNSKYAPSEVGMDNLKNSVQIIGFAKFRIMAEVEYQRSDVLGEPLAGQIRGEFLEYIVDPREVRELLAQYNGR